MSTTNLSSPDKESIQSFFDSISNRYDLINGVLSLRLDEMWRKKMVGLVCEPSMDSVLDLGTGTGKLLEEILKRKSWERAVGLDFSEGMLEIAKGNLSSDAELVAGDFHELPFEDNSFDLVASAYTLRSVKDLKLYFEEIYRVLNPSGAVALLCLTRPKNILFRLLYYPYLKLYMPFVGCLISGDSQAYQFLSQSIQSFQDPQMTLNVMRELGFRSVQKIEFTFGAATLLWAKK